MRLFTDRRALEQTVANLLVLMISLSVVATALSVIAPVMDQYNSRNKIREAEAIMSALYNEILKVEEEPVGAKRTLEVEIEEGGIDILTNPPRLLYYVEVSKEVVIEVEGMDFAYTGRGAMLRINMTAQFLQNSFIGPGSNLIHVSKTPSGRINVTTVVYA
jgi:hypothetical protein